MGFTISNGSRVVELGNENITSTDVPKIVHDLTLGSIQNHDTDSNPVVLIQGVDSRCAPSRGNLGGPREFFSLDVVSAEDIFLGGCSEMSGIWRGREETDD